MGRPKGIDKRYWKYPEQTDHERHVAFLKARSQAAYRSEPWTLTIEEFFYLWPKESWRLRGRKPDELCMIRLDRELAWSIDNCMIVSRYAQLVRDKKARKFPEQKLAL
jgi:hypothetical protein